MPIFLWRTIVEADPSLDETVFEVLGVERAVAAMKSYGSTAPEQVRRQIEDWKGRLAADQS